MSLSKIVRIDHVEDHPDAEHLSIMTIGDLKGVSMKVDSDTGLKHRYLPGDLVLAIFEGAVVPDYLLKRGFWSEEKGIGLLAGGKRGNRMKPSKFRGQLSQFIMFPVERNTTDETLYRGREPTDAAEMTNDITSGTQAVNPGEYFIENEFRPMVVHEGDVVDVFLGVVAQNV